MPSRIAHLSAAERRALMDDLNYLNTAEIRSFCDRHDIPYKIDYETADGKRRRTKESDRKAIVLDRVRHFLKTGKVLGPTVYAADIVRLDGLPKRLKPSDRLYYGWYDKKNAELKRVLGSLTGGAFRDGAIARILLAELWAFGTAPTLREFAAEWAERSEEGLGEHPEAAWLTARARGTAGTDWRAKRNEIAARVLAVLEGV